LTDGHRCRYCPHRFHTKWNRNTITIPLEVCSRSRGRRSAGRLGAVASGEEGASKANDTPKRLVLLRHAHSEPRGESFSDHNRPLSEEGRDASRRIARRLTALGDEFRPDIILCSDSQRTRETLALMAEEVKELSEAETLFLGSLYTVAAMDGETRKHLKSQVAAAAAAAAETGRQAMTVMCMGHNKGWEEAASEFSGVVVSLEPANAAILAGSGATWEDALEGEWGLVTVLRDA